MKDQPLIAPASTEEINVIEYAKNHSGATQRGYKGGRAFLNSGSDGGEVLPRVDENGADITYREYDIHPYTKGVNRGTERVVVGSDGKAYYTKDHYKTFTPIVKQNK
jgi:hypothetical protein